MEKRLLRSNKDRMIAGVCGGLAEYLNLDPTLARIVFVVLTLITGGFFGLVYLLLWIVMPEAGSPAAAPRTVPPSTTIVSTGEAAPTGAGPALQASEAAPAAGTPPSAPSRPRDMRIIGWVLLAIGAYLLLAQLGLGHLLRLVWPLALVVVGLLLLWPFLRRR